MSRNLRFALSSLPLAAALVLAPRAAFAHEPGEIQHAGSPGAEGEGEKKEEPEPPWEALGEVVGGATTTDVLSPGKFTRIELPPKNSFDSTRVTAFSFLFGIERHFGERLTLGARMPFVYANLESRNGSNEDRTVFVAGNLELEGAFVIAHGSTWNLVASLGVALPTAGGKEAPTKDEFAKEPDKVYSYKRYDNFAGIQAGSAVRGAYDSALFEPGRLGIIPAVAANIKLQKLTITPLVKVENLVDVTGDATESYVGEIVGGVRAAYRVLPVFEPGVHIWVNALYTHSDEPNQTIAAVEPYLRFLPSPFKITTGLILPFAGHLTDDKTFGVRVSVIGEF